ncbi:YolD-like family protein [Virgibacillus sp. YIM 98842]|uniref:YolD-like family protein n=1 Tax=Virgibacillus sp. YIM 98842 TaxID=2663533 RepID=UPI0013DC5F60|nr:YolD-like family protein [Virgibacillus sp. YIM 98842]
MVNDRGDIKWTSLMLPEHVQMIKDMWAEDEKKEMPILDEQQIEENMMKLQLAIHNNLSLEIKYFKDHDFHTVKGKLKSIVAGDCIIFTDGVKVNLNDVIEVFID